MVVRPAGRSDLGAVLGLFEELRWDRRREGGTPAPAEAARIWESILGQDGRFILVAEVAGEILGTADLLIVANLTHELRPWAIVEHVVVAPHEERSDAHRFYQAVGFEPTAEGFRRYLV
ncbi:MAG: GNAT family N-acetyltransferase [Actinobacteria bacterium]|nr:MAG: GNAT family N-acetyltransferase [Actinomycetota bacterium]